MGLYSVFLALGQIGGSLLGGYAAEWKGIDGLLGGTIGVLIVALLPLSRLRNQEHQLELEHPEIAPESSGPRARPAEPG
jgi:hypothetical protein